MWGKLHQRLGWFDGVQRKPTEVKRCSSIIHVLTDRLRIALEFCPLLTPTLLVLATHREVVDSEHTRRREGPECQTPIVTPRWHLAQSPPRMIARAILPLQELRVTHAMRPFQCTIPPSWLVVAAAALASLGCILPGIATPTLTSGPPATPAIFLPPAWTPTGGPVASNVPADWEEFQAGRVHLWLPGSFEGGDMGKTFQRVVETLKSLGPDFARTAEILEQDPDVFVLWAFDTERGPSGYITQANVTQEEVPEGLTVEEYLDASIELLPSTMKLVDRGTLSLRNDEAGKLVISSTIAGVRVMAVVYTIKDGDRFWNVTYVTGADEFVQRTPTWEQSIGTFRLDD